MKWVYEAVGITINDQVWWWGYVGRVIWMCVVYVVQYVMKKRVVGGGGLYGYFRE